MLKKKLTLLPCTFNEQHCYGKTASAFHWTNYRVKDRSFSLAPSVQLKAAIESPTFCHFIICMFSRRVPWKGQGHGAEHAEKIKTHRHNRAKSKKHAHSCTHCIFYNVKFVISEQLPNEKHPLLLLPS